MYKIKINYKGHELADDATMPFIPRIGEYICVYVVDSWGNYKITGITHELSDDDCYLLTELFVS